MRQAVVLCGGLGTRLGAATRSLPKVLVAVAGRPFLERLLERITSSGFDSVVLCIGHMGELVREAALAWRPAGVDLAFAVDGPVLLGTGGALVAARHLLAPSFLVTYGDSYLGFDYAGPLDALEAHPNAEGCMAVYENHDRLEPSNASVRGDWVARYDKARSAPEGLDHIDYGATALRRSVLDTCPPEQAFGLDAIQTRLAAEGRLLAFRAPERFYEIGSPSGLAELERALGDDAAEKQR